MQLLYGFLLALLIASIAYYADSLDQSGAIAATVVGTVIFGLKTTILTNCQSG
jgi:uncharacterized membrane protein